MSVFSAIIHRLIPHRRNVENGTPLVPFRRLCAWLWHTWRGYRLQAILNSVIGLVLVLSDLAFVWCTKFAVDIATRCDTSHSLSFALVLLGSVITLQIVLGVASRWIRATLGVKAQNKMQKHIFRHLLDSKWKDMKKFHSGNILNRIERDVTDIVSFLTESIPSFINTIVQFLGAFTFLFLMDGQLAFIVLLVIPFFLISSRLYVKKMRRLTHKVRDTESRIQAILQESIQHTLVIKTLERTQTTLSKLSARQQQLQDEVVKKTVYSTVTSTLMNVGFAAGYLVTFTWGTTGLYRGAITYGALIAFVQLVAQIQSPVKQLTRYVSVFIGAFTATERVMELQAVPLEERHGDLPVGRGASISLKDVTFSYTPTSRRIFDHFDFSFPSGSITAILGETGSGKTTLIRLLLALITPQDGHITLTDDEGHNFEASPDARCNFSYVPQGNTLLSGTVRSNLLMSKPDATEDELFEVLELAGADFLKTMPEGLDTPCGELGDGLSEGQAQRVAIARALLKPSPFLLLDEATSALDAETERRVLQNIIQRYPGRTMIFVTHRPEILKYCSQTFTLVKNRIARA